MSVVGGLAKLATQTTLTAASGNAEGFGSNARALRLSRGQTLDQLAAETGLSKGHLSRFERGEKTLSIAALMRVSRALGTSVAALLGERPSGAPFHLVRAGQAVTLAPGVDGGYTYRALSRPDGGPLSAFVVDLPEHSSRTSEAAHRGEEAFLVLSGRVEIDLGGETILLQTGDYIQFSGAIRHRIRSMEGPSRLFVVVSGD